MASITLDENTYIRKKMNFFMCSKCDMICAETVPLPDGTFFKDDTDSSFCDNNHKKTQKLQAKRIYCVACDDEYTDARRNYGLIKHWLCCAFRSPCS